MEIYSKNDLSFKEKYLCQTKKLVNGNRFFVYSTKIVCSRNVYKCNLCGLSEIKDDKDLELHDRSVLHRELSKLSAIPYKNWMEDCFINSNDKINATESFKTMLTADFMQDYSVQKSTSKKKKVPKKYKTARAVHSRALDSSSSESVDEVDINRLISLDNLRNTSILRMRNQQKSFSEGDKFIEPTFLSMCRQLTSLEEYLEDNLRDGVKKLFLKSIELERASMGSSNTLLTMDNLEFLFHIKATLSSQLDTIPIKFLSIVNVFYDDMLHFTEKFALKTQRMNKTKLYIEQSKEFLKNIQVNKGF